MKRTPLLAILLLVAPGCAPKDDGSIRLNGRLEAPMVDLAPKVAGRVLEVLVREGDRVKSGDLLVRLDLGDTAVSVERDRQGVSSAEARLQDFEAGSRTSEIRGAEDEVTDRRAAVDLARRELERQENLLAKKVGTPRDTDLARTALERAEANVKMSEQRLRAVKEGFRRFQTEQARADVGRARTVLKQSEIVAKEAELRAPADGIVLHRMAEPGLLLGGGQPALTMAFANRLYVRAYIPEAKLGRVTLGSPATVSVDAFPGKTFAAKVTEISPDAEFTPKPVETRAERVNLVYATKVDLLGGWNEPLVPGQPAEVIVAGGAPEAPGAPATPPATPPR